MQVMVNMYMDVRAELKVATNGSVFKLETLQVVPALVTKVMMKKVIVCSFIRILLLTHLSLSIFFKHKFIFCG